MSERAERLLERVATAISSLVPSIEPADDQEAVHVLRAVVEELGVTSIVASTLRHTARFSREPEVHDAAHAVATLLEAAGEDQ